MTEITELPPLPPGWRPPSREEWTWEAAPKSRMRRLDVARMLRTTPPPIPWVIEPLCARGNVTLLSGREGEGKSIIAMAIAGAVGRGESLADLRCSESGLVIYFDAENGENTIHNRIHLLGISGGLEIWEPNGLSLGRHLAEFEERLIQFRPVLAVFDSLRSTWPEGDENDSASTERFLSKMRNLARNHDTAILILHHMAKDTRSGYRGSTAIGAGVQIIASLRRDETDAAVRILEWRKCRLREEPRAMALRFINCGAQLRIASDVAAWDYHW